MGDRFWSRLLVPSGDVVFKEIEAKGVLLNLENGNYYTLNGTGSYIWSLLDPPRPLREILSAVTQRFSVEADVAAEDIRSMVDTLAAEGLVELHDDPQGS